MSIFFHDLTRSRWASLTFWPLQSDAFHEEATVGHPSKVIPSFLHLVYRHFFLLLHSSFSHSLSSHFILDCLSYIRFLFRLFFAFFFLSLHLRLSIHCQCGFLLPSALSNLIVEGSLTSFNVAKIDSFRWLKGNGGLDGKESCVDDATFSSQIIFFFNCILAWEKKCFFFCLIRCGLTDKEKK